jgi:hypothetical protein
MIPSGTAPALTPRHAAAADIDIDQVAIATSFARVSPFRFRFFVRLKQGLAAQTIPSKPLSVRLRHGFGGYSALLNLCRLAVGAVSSEPLLGA